MYEEDRQTALAMYSQMFDDAEDEQALLQLLVSPTKQAVIIARAYDAKVRKLQVEAQSRAADEGQEAAPNFILAIDEIYQKVRLRQPEEPDVLEDQFSLFEGDRHPIRDEEYVPFPAAPGEEEEPAPEGDSVDQFMEEFSIEHDELAPAAEETPAKAPAQEAPEEAAKPEKGQTAPLASLAKGQTVPLKGQTAPLKGQTAPLKGQTAPLKGQTAPLKGQTVPLTPPAQEEPSVPMKRRTKVLALIVYLIFAIPLTLAGILLLLIPTAAALGAAVLAIVSGALVLVSAFGGFAVFADIMIVLGAALVILAFGLLLLWLFIWLIGGAMTGLVRGVRNLGRRWCTEEVPV